jgi:hypothetical protein
MEEGEVSENSEIVAYPPGESISLAEMDWDDDELTRAWDAAMSEYLQNDPENTKNIIKDQSKKKRRKNNRDRVENKNESHRDNVKNNREEVEFKNESQLHNVKNNTSEHEPTSFEPDLESNANIIDQDSKKIPNFPKGFDHLTAFPYKNSIERKDTMVDSELDLQDDDDLSAKLMMSWYWAGYYTALYNQKKSNKL